MIESHSQTMVWRTSQRYDLAKRPATAIREEAHSFDYGIVPPLGVHGRIGVLERQKCEITGGIESVPLNLHEQASQ